MAIKPLPNEHVLLAKIAGGDQRAFKELFEWYARPLGEFVLKLTHSNLITEEIVQDAFVKIWLRRETLTAIENFSSYLYILCRNHTFAVLKKMATEKANHLLVEEHILDELETDEYDNPAEEYRQLIDDAVTRLPAQQQKAYMLSRYQRMKHEEIAKELGLSPETVKKHIQLAVQFIRKELSTPGNTSIIIVLTSTWMIK